MKLTVSDLTRRGPYAAGPAIIAAIVVSALYLGRQVLVPIALAGLLSFILMPLLARLQRLGLGRIPSVIVLTLFSFSLLAGIGAVVGTQITQLAGNLPQYQYGLQEKIESVRDKAANGPLLRSISKVIQGLGTEMTKPSQPDAVAPAPNPSAAPANPAEQPPIPVVMRQPPPTPYEIASQILGPAIEPIATAGIVIVFVVFILLQRGDLRDRLIWFAGARDLRRTTNALDDAAARLSRYFLAQTAINTAFGFVLGAGLWLIGIPNFILWGSLATLLRFLPYVGGFLSAIIPLVLAAAVDPGWTKLLWTAGLFAGLELVTGQVIEPLLFGRTTGMSPLAVVTAATFWTWLWGPIGLMLSTPLTLLLVVLGQHVERFNFLAVLFGDSPPLAPEESFYHKVISGHTDEVIEQTYAVLKEQPLVDYYDAVALPGLRMLQYDLNTGSLPPESLPNLIATIDEIIDVLDEYDDVGSEEEKSDADPQIARTKSAAERYCAAWRSEFPVLCIAGRSPFDYCVAAMLKQLLAREGIGMRVCLANMASPSQLSKLEAEGAVFVCLSYVAVDHSPSHTRFLIRRLRRRIPGAKILAGFWTCGVDEDVETRRELLRTESGADMIATALGEAVAICLREAAAAPQLEARPQAVRQEQRSVG
jgi:predicted PurR-regulated permease PerM